MSTGLIKVGRSNGKDIFTKEFSGVTFDSNCGITFKCSDTAIPSYTTKRDDYDGYFNPVVYTPRYHVIPEIKDVVFNPPYTIVKWCDDTTTKVRCINEDDFNEEIGLAMAISRRYYEFNINSGWTLAKEDKKETKGARSEFKKQVKNAKRPKKKE